VTRLGPASRGISPTPGASNDWMKEQGKAAVRLAALAVLALSHAPAHAAPETPPVDKGIFEDLNGAVSFSLPSGLTAAEEALYRPAATQRDRDRDGIPDQLDVLLGALKAALNGASYDTSYRRIPFPMGDVPREVGCCSDVVVRALRNAGLDLQALLQRDIARRPSAYPHVTAPNPSIDHRRVRNLLVFMRRHLTALRTDVSSPSGWLPGDIVLFDTLPKAGPDHIGIISSNMAHSGMPMVINNWTWGSATAEMDLLPWCPVTHHFRLRQDRSAP